jgi:outer membrane immunogenic protein
VKARLLLSTLIVPTLLTAVPAGAQSPLGVYGGLQGGYGRTSVEATATTASGSASDDDSSGDLIGGVFLGFGGRNSRLYGAVEGDFSINNNEKSYSSGSDSLKIEQGRTFGVSGLVGYYVTDQAMIYGRAGWAQTKFEATVNTSDGSASEDDNFNGFRLGGGADFMFTSNLFARAEYSHTWYGENTYISGTNSISLEPSEDLFLVGVGYRF